MLSNKINHILDNTSTKIRWVTAIVISIILSYILFYQLAFSGLLFIIIEMIINYELFTTICPKKGKIPVAIATIPVVFFSFLNIYLWSTYALTPELELLINNYQKNMLIGGIIAVVIMLKTTPKALKI